MTVCNANFALSQNRILFSSFASERKFFYMEPPNLDFFDFELVVMFMIYRMRLIGKLIMYGNSTAVKYFRLEVTRLFMTRKLWLFPTEIRLSNIFCFSKMTRTHSSILLARNFPKEKYWRIFWRIVCDMNKTVLISLKMIEQNVSIWYRIWKTFEF